MDSSFESVMNGHFLRDYSKSKKWPGPSCRAFDPVIYFGTTSCGNEISSYYLAGDRPAIDTIACL